MIPYATCLSDFNHLFEFFFLINNLFFRGILGSRQHCGEGTEVSHILPARVPSMHSLLYFQHPHQHGAIATIDEPPLGAVHSVGLDKCIIT